MSKIKKTKEKEIVKVKTIDTPKASQFLTNMILVGLLIILSQLVVTTIIVNNKTAEIQKELLAITTLEKEIQVIRDEKELGMNNLYSLILNNESKINHLAQIKPATPIVKKNDIVNNNLNLDVGIGIITSPQPHVTPYIVKSKNKDAIDSFREFLSDFEDLFKL